MKHCTLHFQVYIDKSKYVHNFKQNWENYTFVIASQVAELQIISVGVGLIKSNLLLCYVGS